jgi:hypothetical protein
MLLGLDVLTDELRKRFSHPEFDLSDLCLLSPGVTPDVIGAAERALGIMLPESFSKTVMIYNFARLSLCNLVFAFGRNLERFVRSNLGEPFPWWGYGPRPRHLLLVGSTDAHSILMTTEDGAVQAMSEAAEALEDRVMIANDFEILVRTAGSIALGISMDQRIAIARDVSTGLFWEHLAQGAA